MDLKDVICPSCKVVTTASVRKIATDPSKGSFLNVVYCDNCSYRVYGVDPPKVFKPRIQEEEDLEE